MIVAFYSHGSRAGKDTAADALAAELDSRGERVCQTAFADTLKTTAAVALGMADIGDKVDEVIVEVDRFKLHGSADWRYIDEKGGHGARGYVAGREYLIRLATAIRAHDPQFFVRPVLELADSPAYDVTIVSDMRFEVELAALESHGYATGMPTMTVEVTRPELEHHNEDRLSPKFPWLLPNDGSIEELRGRVIDELAPAVMKHVGQSRS